MKRMPSAEESDRVARRREKTFRRRGQRRLSRNRIVG